MKCLLPNITKLFHSIILGEHSVLDIAPYLTGKSSFLYIQGEPFVLPVAQGRMMKLIIVAFAAFFVTVFLAFILNAIRNIKADPHASKILSDAWKAGK